MESVELEGAQQTSMEIERRLIPPQLMLSMKHRRDVRNEVEHCGVQHNSVKMTNVHYSSSSGSEPRQGQRGSEEHGKAELNLVVLD